jgi:hypothetical protein
MADGDAGTTAGTTGSNGDDTGADDGDGGRGVDGATTARAGAGLALLGLSLVADGVAGGRVAGRIGRARTVAVGGAVLAVGVTLALAVTRGSDGDGDGGVGSVATDA